jgi:hypothetical protein
MYLWRAVDHEGEILDMLVQRRRDQRAALKLMRKSRRSARLVAPSEPRNLWKRFDVLRFPDLTASVSWNRRES